MLAVEHRGAQVCLQHPDAVCNGCRGDVKLVCSPHEALMPGGGIEKAEAVERRKGLHDLGLGV